MPIQLGCVLLFWQNYLYQYSICSSDRAEPEHIQSEVFWLMLIGLNFNLYIPDISKIWNPLDDKEAHVILDFL